MLGPQWFTLLGRIMDGLPSQTPAIMGLMQVSPSASATASTHASFPASTGREARHVPPAAEQASWQLWPSAPRCHVMSSLPHAQSLPGRCGGSGGGSGERSHSWWAAPAAQPDDVAEGHCGGEAT